jgi:Flp pilus assembly protein TadG
VQRHPANTYRDLARATRGQEVVEFALIVPLLFMLLIGIFWFGQAFRIYGTITNAARDGARAAVSPPCSTCTAQDPSQNAWNAVQSDLQVARLNPNVLAPPATLPAVCACGSAAAFNSCTAGAVACDASQPNICVQGITHSGTTVNEGLVMLSSTGADGGLNGGAGACGVSVSFVYPYTFPLPFTSIGNRTINLRAQAQMRAETQ